MTTRKARVYLGDSLDLLDALPPGSVDAVVRVAWAVANPGKVPGGRG